MHVSGLFKKNRVLADRFKILTRVRQYQGITNLLQEISKNKSFIDERPSIIPFGMAKEECQYDTVIAPGREEIAKMVHEDYQKKEKKERRHAKKYEKGGNDPRLRTGRIWKRSFVNPIDGKSITFTSKFAC